MKTTIKDQFHVQLADIDSYTRKTGFLLDVEVERKGNYKPRRILIPTSNEETIDDQIVTVCEKTKFDKSQIAAVTVHGCEEK